MKPDIELMVKLTRIFLSLGALVFFIGCNNANVNVTGLTSSIFRTPAPPIDTMGSPRSTLTGGNMVLTAQVASRGQTTLSGGTMVLEAQVVK